MNDSDVAPSLAAIFRREGYRPVPLALISDVNQIHADGCGFCGSNNQLHVEPYWGEGIRLLVTCNNCWRAWEA
jgi:hypothetical protein